MSERGPIGRDGATGAEGRAGTTGRDGGEGHIGERGERGVTGEQGMQGDIGGQGVQGVQGARGPAGSRNAAIGFLILMTFAFFGLLAVQRQADETIDALREGCRGVNVLRANQAGLIADQVRTTEPLLRKRGGLGGLERFREQIEQQQRDRKMAIAGLRRSVAEYPVDGRPYHTDCVAAYP